MELNSGSGRGGTRSAFAGGPAEKEQRTWLRRRERSADADKEHGGGGKLTVFTAGHRPRTPNAGQASLTAEPEQRDDSLTGG